MAKETYEIRFDRHGHIVVEDPELKRRLRALLQHDHQVVFRLVGDQPAPDGVMPNLTECLLRERIVIDRLPPRNGILCPNDVCDGGWLKVVNVPQFEQLMTPPRPRPEER